VKSNEVFTQKEFELIKNYSLRQSKLQIFSFYFFILLTPLIFATYGLVNRDPIAVFVAFGGLLIFIIWLVLSLMKNEELLNSVCEKILEQEILKSNENESL